MDVLGVDVFRHGWVALMLSDGAYAHASAHSTFREVLTRYPTCAAIAVDMPIGLPEGVEPRLADLQARAFVGPRRSSVFETVPRAALEAPTHAEAVRRCQELIGRGLSAQSYALAAKIFEVEESKDDRVWEVHPEVSFCALAGTPLVASKKTYNGVMHRQALLRAAGIVLPYSIGLAGDAAADDVLDAAAAAWSAHRIASGTASSLPTPPQVIGGQPVAIWY
jgi:predicted RNase H-like nuclease